MMPTWPLLGRDEALERVGSLLREPALSGVVLVGPAGVGKTRLAKECLAMGEAAGFATALVVASRAARPIPLGALAALLPTAAAAPGPAMLHRAQEGLVALAAGRPLLLVVDDAHSLDEASALVVLQLAASPSNFVVATVRSGESVPDPVLLLWKDEVAERLEIGPLPPDDVGRLLEAVLGGPLEAVALQQLWNASEGNVLYLRELVLSGLESHTLVDDGGLWRIVGSIASSPRLIDLVESRLGGLDARQLAAMELVAFGEPLGVDIVSGLTSADALDTLQTKGLIAVEVDDRRAEARLAHPLHGDVLRESTPVVRARSVQRDLADALDATGSRRRGDVLRVAVWRLESGGETTPELLLAAATQAKFSYDTEAARRLSRAALDAGPSFEAGYLLAECLYDLGRTKETEEVFASMEEWAKDDQERGLMVALRSFNLFWHLRNYDDATHVVDQAIASMDAAGAIAEVSGRFAVLEATAGRPLRAMARAEPVLDQLDGLLPGDLGNRAFCQASLAAGLALPMLGRSMEGAVMAERGAKAYMDLGYQLSMFEPALLRAAHAMALGEYGHAAAGEALALDGFSRSLALRDGGGLAFNALVLGVIHLEQGRLLESERWWREAASRFRSINHLGILRWALAGLLFAQALRADVEGAAVTSAELDEIGPHPAQMQEANLLRATAWLAVAEQHPARARALLIEAADHAAGAGVLSQELAALHDLARLGRAAPIRTRADAVAAQVDGPLGAARLAHIHALGDDDADGLLAVSAAFEGCGSLLAAAEAATAAVDAFRRRNKVREATALSRRAADLTARCEGAATPGLQRIDGPTPLTRREVEIARLAATGFASRDIADQLFLSVRTVDNHLARIYEKLGITGRAELVDALPTVGPV